MTPTKRKVAGPGAVTAAFAAAIVAVAGVAFVVSQNDHGANPAAGGGAAPASGALAAKAEPQAHKTGDKPLWRALTPAQQHALQPLQGEWDQMDGVRKQKWLLLANRFASLRPEEQQRLHERMRLWVKLTPEQRDLARETYTRTRKITQDQKTATWESYQQLPEEQKKKLAASSATRKAPTVVSTQANGKVVAPLGQGATSCPVGMVKNPVSATPPCVTPPAPLPPAPQVPAPIAPNPQSTPPVNPPQQEKPVPANWGITPNNA